MTSKVYSGLFEDEVAEVLRDNTSRDMTIIVGHRMFMPACMICEDGIYSSGAGRFTEYINGKRTGSHISIAGLIRTLAHETFTIKTRHTI